MKNFTLLVNGQDLDTGIYEYFPYVDKAITDFRTTRKIISELKNGKAVDKVDDYIYARYCVGNNETNKLAIQSAYEAFQKFRHFPQPIRKKIFLDMYKLLLQKKEEFIKILILEGHPRKLAEWEFEGMEIGGRPETIDFFCRQLQKEVGRTKKEVLYWTRRPDGVVCLNPPNNAAASNSYLAAYVFLVGNALVVKPPLRSPLSTIFLWKEVVNEALKRNDAPPGLLNVVLGNSQVIMDEWLSDSRVNDVIYFGTSNKGIEIGMKVFQAGKKPVLELSGNDFLIVWEDGDIEKATDSLIECFLGSTQICMVPKVALIHQGIYEKFVSKYLEKVRKIKVGLPSDSETMLSPVTKMQDYSDFLKDALEKGAKIIYGGERVNHYDKEDKNGLYIRPTLLRIEDSKDALEMKLIKEEIFFPLLPLIKVNGEDEEIFEKIVNMVSIHNYGLRISLWVSSPKYLRKFAKYLDNSGLLRINTRHVGFSLYLSTHGGTRRSGGPFGEMNYIWQKTSHLQGVTRKIL